MDRAPRILAGFVQGSLEAADSLEIGLGERVRAQLKPEQREAIQDTWPAGWLPITCDVAVTEVLFALAGEARACELMRRNLADTFHKPILRPMIEGALRLLGARTESLLRWAPRAWSLLFRDVGRMQVEAVPGHASVCFTGLPAEVAESRPYLLGTAAALSAIFELTQETGSCRLLGHGRGEARFELRWGPEV